MSRPFNQGVAEPRWFVVVASREVDSDSMQFQSSTDVRVFATSETDAMRKVRLEFRGFHLRVLP